MMASGQNRSPCCGFAYVRVQAIEIVDVLGRGHNPFPSAIPIYKQVPGVERQPLKKLAVDESALLKLLNRWREEAEQAGHGIKRIAVVFWCAGGWSVIRYVRSRTLGWSVFSMRSCGQNVLVPYFATQLPRQSARRPERRFRLSD
jgi:hypothetical protein